MPRLIIPGIPLAFKTKRIRDEFLDAPLDPRLRAILLEQGWHIAHEYGYLYELTDLIRTRSEQRALYPNDPDKRSVHEFRRGADGVIRGFEKSDYRLIEAWTNKYFPYQKAKYRTCKYHDIGHGAHLHNQVTSISAMQDFFSDQS